MTFTPSDRFAGQVHLHYGDVPVGQGTITRTTPYSYGTTGFAVGYQPGSPVSAELEGRAQVTPGVLRRVVIQVQGRPQRDPARQARSDLATQ